MALLTKLEAVNRVLLSIKLSPVTSLDTGNFSEASNAEREIDYWNKIVQLEGFHGNRVMSKEYTAANLKVTLGADVIAIKAAGPSQHRHFDIRKVGADKLVYDLDRDSSVFANGEKIYLDITVEIPFGNCPVYIQHAIVARAMQEFQRRWMGDPLRDETLAEQRVRSEAITPRASGNSMSDRSNPAPFSLDRSGEGRRQ